MSTSIDDRIVKMEFDNRQFESGVKTSLSSLAKLKQSLNLDASAKSLNNLKKAGDSFNLTNLASTVEEMASKFSTLGVIGVTALQNITNTAINTAKEIANALVIEPITTGFKEYETQIGATQTILANTQKEGATIKDVNKALDELNKYADLTIYNFTEMTKNIGTFTAAGVKLDTSANAIQGIANLAAVSGSTSQQASTAMYQLSQALASGTVKLMDWNSVVNAGMGGKTFQDALIATAKVHGVAIDSMIKKEGSFRETLKNEWLTSDILTETLQHFTTFTDEYNEKTLAAQGYTKAQIEEIKQMGITATDAATKVKTFSQLWDVLKEAAQSGWSSSWRIIIGDFEEAKVTLTSVSNVLTEMLNASSDARNKMLTDWKALGGRTEILKSIENVFYGILDVIGPIKSAFREIFPAMTGEQLFGISKSLRELTEKFKMTDETADNLKNTFKGIFSVAKTVTILFKNLLNVTGNIIGSVLPLGNTFLNITGNIGKFVSETSNAVSSSTTLASGFEKLNNCATNFGLAVKNVISKLSPAISSLFSIAMKCINGIFGAIDKAFNGGSFLQLFTFINGGLLANMLISFKKFFGEFAGQIKSGNGLFSNIKEVLNDVRESLQAWQMSLKAEAIQKIAISLGILAASLVVLSLIEPTRLAGALTAITVLFIELTIMLNVLSESISGKKFKGITKINGLMLSLSTSILVLSLAMKTLSDLDWNGIAKGLVTVMGLTTALVVVAQALSSKGSNFMKGATGLIAFSLAIKVMASAVSDLSKIDFQNLMSGLAGIMALLAGLTLTSKVLSANSSKFTMSAIGLIGLAASIKIIASATIDLSTLNIQEISKGILALGGILASLAIFLKATSSVGGIGNGLNFVAMAAGITVIASAFSKLGSMNLSQIGKGLLVLGGSLAILATGLYAMNSTLAGSAALLVASTAMAVLAPSLILLSSISWAGVGKSLITLAGAFTILGLSSLVLTPLIPAILGLAGALALIGIGISATGAGLVLIGSGLTAITLGLGGFIGLIASGAVAIVEALTIIITGIANAIPLVIAKIGEGIILFAATIAKGASSIAEAVLALIDGVLLAIENHAESIIKGLIKVVIAVFKALLSIIAEYFGPLFSAGVKAIGKFISGIGSKIKGIWNTGKQSVQKFIDGIKSKIKDVIAIGKNVIDGFIIGIHNKLSSLSSSVKNVGKVVINGLKKVLDINSPSKETQKLANYTVDGFIKGLQNGKSRLETAVSESMGKPVVNALKKDLAEVMNSLSYGQKAISKFILSFGDLSSQTAATNSFWAAKAAVDDYAKSLYMESDAYKENLDNVKALVKERKSIRKEIEALSKKTDDESKDRVKTLKQNLKETTKELRTAKKEITEGTKEFIKNQREAYNELRDSISDSIKSSIDPMSVSLDTQIDLFKKFGSEAEEILSDDIISNMESQVEGISKWNENLEILAQRGFAKGLLDQLKSMGPSASNYIQAFMTMTNEQMIRANEVFAESSKLTSETLLQNFKTSLESAKQWAADLAELAARGLNQGMIEQLGKAGTGSAEYVEAFMSMTASQLGEFNKSYAEYLKLPKDVASDVMATFSFAGSDMATALSKDLMTFASPESEQNQQLVANMTTTGQRMVTGLKKGAESKKKDAKSSATSIGKAVYNGFNTYISTSSGSSLGQQMCSGLVQGLEAGRSSVINAAVRTAVAAYRAACEALDVNSPSKKFESLGRFADLGLARGFRKYSFIAEDEAEGLGKKSISSLKSALLRVGQVIDSDIDPSPVIRPVVDLDDLKSGIATMNGYIGNKTIDIGIAQKTAAKISSGMNRDFQSSDSLQMNQNGNSFNFTQYNYSPKALSPVDIYRQTKNQFSAMKGALEGV